MRGLRRACREPPRHAGCRQMEGGDGAVPLSSVRTNERKGRIRELLATYYTQEHAGGKSLEQREASTDPCDLDGAAFDVE